jgi:hypothetical protein
MSKLAEAFERFGPAYMNEFEDTMPSVHRKALHDILACHTNALGGSIHKCKDCGTEVYLNHSCRNRACPKCQNEKTDAWAENLREKLLPVAHFHVIVTLPAELRDLVRSNQRKANAVLMKAAFATLRKLSKGNIGAIGVLHTWSRSLIYHPHVHFIVPAGWVSNDGSTWTPSNPGFLVPIPAFKKVFPAIFAKMLRKELPGIKLPQRIWQKKWNVRMIPFDGGLDNLINYLARYIYRIAISDNRIIEVTDTHVIFRGDKRPVKLTGQEFIRRFLQHVPPKGFHKVRYFGIMHPANTTLCHRIRLTLPAKAERKTEAKPEKPAFICPDCGCIHAIVRLIVPNRTLSRAPP